MSVVLWGGMASGFQFALPDFAKHRHNIRCLVNFEFQRNNKCSIAHTVFGMYLCYEICIVHLNSHLSESPVFYLTVLVITVSFSFEHHSD